MKKKDGRNTVQFIELLFYSIKIHNYKVYPLIYNTKLSILNWEYFTAVAYSLSISFIFLSISFMYSCVLIKDTPTASDIHPMDQKRETKQDSKTYMCGHMKRGNLKCVVTNGPQVDNLLKVKFWLGCNLLFCR